MILEEQLVHRALRVVLQYWMVPNLGWTTMVFQEKLPLLRAAIIKKASQDGKKQTVYSESETGYFDEDYLIAMQEEFYEFPRRYLFIKPYSVSISSKHPQP
jgi:hypothetical protein